MRDCSGGIEDGQMAHVIEGLAEAQAKFKSKSARSFIHSFIHSFIVSCRPVS